MELEASCKLWIVVDQTKHAIIIVNWFMTDHDKIYWEALKWILTYLNVSLNNGLKYTKGAQKEDTLEMCTLENPFRFLCLPCSEQL